MNDKMKHAKLHEIIRSFGYCTNSQANEIADAIAASATEQAGAVRWVVVPDLKDDGTDQTAVLQRAVDFAARLGGSIERAAPVSGEQKPVAWLVKTPRGFERGIYSNYSNAQTMQLDGDDVFPLYTTPPAAQDKGQDKLREAAPDLLAALQGVVRVADRATDEFVAAHSAIAKATGAPA